MNEVQFQDCVARWDSCSLILSNSKIIRKWSVTNGLCYNVSFTNVVTGKEYLKKESSHPSPSPEFMVEEKCLNLKIEAVQYQPVALECVSLRVSLSADYGSYRLVTNFTIYPGSPAVTSNIEIYGRSPEMLSEQQDHTLFGDGIEKDDFIKKMKMEEAMDNNEVYQFNNIHSKLGIVCLMDHTDNKDNLVRVQEDLLTVASQEEYRSNLFYLEDQITHEGLIFLKEAPLSYARPYKTSKDLAMDASFFRFCGLGGGEDKERVSYPFTTIAYENGKAGRVKALQDYQRKLRCFDFERDAVIWYSIWGDRNRDGKMCEEYMLKSVDLLEELGMDFLYFIDGWQKGASANSVIADGKWSNQ